MKPVDVLTLSSEFLCRMCYLCNLLEVGEAVTQPRLDMLRDRRLCGLSKPEPSQST